MINQEDLFTESQKPSQEWGGEDSQNAPASEEPPGDPESAPNLEQSDSPDPADEVEKFREMALRAHADLDNFRKRATREKEDSIRYANASLLEKLLPLLDNFDLGLEAASSTAGADAVVSGFSMVRKQLDEFLRSAGVEKIAAEGVAFDPKFHEAMASLPSDEIPEGMVVKQLRPGYKLHDRLLRPAGVIVSKGPAPASRKEDLE